MLIGVPKETKAQEYRVGLTPTSVRELVSHGHRVVVEAGAGAGINMFDQDYRGAGASVAASATEVFGQADMVVKVKEPQPDECRLLRPGQILWTYLHLAPDPVQTGLLIESDCVAFAYETVTGPGGSLPLLAPMSEVAGRMSVQAGAHCLEKRQGGAGVLLGGVPGVGAANVVVIGGGVVGTNAIRVAMGMEARVIVIDKSLRRLQELDFQFGCMLNTVFATVESLERYVAEADLLIGAVLIPGSAAPKLITREMVGAMHRGAVLVDVAIDQGGCAETSRATTHAEPTYEVDGVVHYCVANMPGAVPRTSTIALNNATLPFTLALANKGYRRAALDDPNLLNGLNVHRGRVTYEAVAKNLGHAYCPAREALAPA